MEQLKFCEVVPEITKKNYRF